MPDQQTIFDAMEDRLLTLLPPDISTADIHWDNVTKLKPSQQIPFARVHFQLNTTNLQNMGVPGTRRLDSGGACILGLFAQKNDGDALRTIRAKRRAIELDFRSNPFSGVIFQTFLHSEPGVDGDYYQVNMSALFKFDDEGY
jgi:hypothetical protein